MKLRASVRLLLEWLRGAGFEQLAQQFFAKLTSVANLLAMPGSQLVQVRDARLEIRSTGKGMGRSWHLVVPFDHLMRLVCSLSLAALSWGGGFVGRQYQGGDAQAHPILSSLSLPSPS